MEFAGSTWTWMPPWCAIMEGGAFELSAANRGAYAALVHGIASCPQPKPKVPATPATGGPRWPHPPNPRDTFDKAVWAVSRALDRQSTVCWLRSSVNLGNRFSVDLATAAAAATRSALERLPRTPLEHTCLLFHFSGCECQTCGAHARRVLVEWRDGVGRTHLVVVTELGRMMGNVPNLALSMLYVLGKFEGGEEWGGHGPAAQRFGEGGGGGRGDQQQQQRWRRHQWGEDNPRQNPTTPTTPQGPQEEAPPLGE